MLARRGVISVFSPRRLRKLRPRSVPGAFSSPRASIAVSLTPDLRALDGGAGPA
jgi:hypothetical protein